jgi:fluoroquinolone transport system permease protein
VTAVAALVRLEIRVQARYRVFAVLAAVTAAMVGCLAVAALVSAGTARAVTPYVLLVDTATVGTVVAAALVLSGRGEGALPAQLTTPPGAAGLLLTRAGILLAVTLAAAVPVALPALLAGSRGPFVLAPLLAGVTLVAAPLMLLSCAVAARSQTLTGYLVAAPALLTPLLGVPLLAGIGLLNHPLVNVVPTVAAFDLMRAAVDPGVRPGVWPVAWSAAVTLATGLLAVRDAAARLRSGAPSPTRRDRERRMRPALRHPHRGGALSTVVAFARTDVRLVARDAVLAVVVASPMLLGAALRWGYPGFQQLLGSRYGVDLTPHRLLLASALVVLHVPFTFGMVGGLLVLDDRDDRVLTALRVSPLTVQRYLAYRVATVTVGSAAALAVAAPLSGLVPFTRSTSGPVIGALVLAALLAPVVTLTLTAFAGSRVEGVLVVKALGFPLYLPLVLGYLSGPLAVAATVSLGWSPSTWVAGAFEAAATSDDGAGPAAAVRMVVGVLVTAAVLASLARRSLTRLAG